MALVGPREPHRDPHQPFFGDQLIDDISRRFGLGRVPARSVGKAFLKELRAHEVMITSLIVDDFRVAGRPWPGTDQG